ncbi:MAG: DUF5060 domain-containing protein [Verrucomicrobia bacterium]|nr:DUF5060 domain-containing protein [Verrucomicrobiota bacterium]
MPRHGLVEWQIRGIREYTNPYDPDEVDVWIEVRQPSGRVVTIPGFHHQPHEYARRRRGGGDADWLYPTGHSGWRARFSPDEIGGHDVAAVVRDRSGVTRSGTARFRCEPSASRGFVRVSERDPRFYEFGDGSPFFPIGQNLAFIGNGQYVDLAKADEIFGKLAANGANFVRVWTCSEDWALAIEARKSAWGRSWDWRPPFAPVPGREGYHDDAQCVVLEGTRSNLSVSPSQPVAIRAGTRYRLTARILTEGEARVRFVGIEGRADGAAASAKPGEWERFAREFMTGGDQWWLGELRVEREGPGRVWLRDLSLREADDGPELLWEADPDRPPRGVINEPDAAALDQLLVSAARHGVYLQLCLLTRDHYMDRLRDPRSATYRRATDEARKLLRYAVARWGWSANVATWEYFNEMDPGAPTEAFYRELGEFLAQTDPYRRPRTTSGWGPAPNDWKHPAMDSAQLHWYLRPAWGPLWQDEVAAVLDRAALVCGQADRRPALLAEFGLADDRWGLSPYMRQDTAGVHFRNALWASAFPGLAGTAMFWWWEVLDQQNAYVHYRPLARFLADAPFATGGWRAVQTRTESGDCRVLAWQAHDRLVAWVCRADATWWNQVVEKSPRGRTTGERLLVRGMAAGEYDVEWWDTRSGEVAARGSATATSEGLELTLLEFTDDLAFKARRRP